MKDFIIYVKDEVVGEVKLKITSKTEEHARESHERDYPEDDIIKIEEVL